MNKYVNVLIFSFFSLMISEYEVGLTFFIPIAVYFGLKNYKNIILILLVITVAIYFKLTSVDISLLIFSSSFVIYKLANTKYDKIYLNVAFCFALNVITYGVSYGFSEMILLIFYSIVSAFMIGYFYFNQENSLYITSNIGGLSYNELLMSFIAIVGGTVLKIEGINIGLCVALFYGMYFTSNKQYGKSIFYIMITTFSLQYVFHIEESFIIFFVAPLFLFPRMVSTILLFSVCIYLMLTHSLNLDQLLLQLIMGIGLFFEVVRFSLISENDENVLFNNIYENVVETVNNDTVSFASFLDMINKEMSYSKEYNFKTKEVIKTLYKNHCEGCVNRKECFNKNKGKIYYYYKNLITGKDENYIACSFHNDLKRTAYSLANKYNVSDCNSKNDLLTLVTTSLSTILRQYNIDNTLKNELDYQIFYNIKKDIIDYGLTLTLYNVKSAFLDNLLIEVGICGMDFKSIVTPIEKICNNYIVGKVSLIYNNTEKGRVYFNIVPKVNYEVTYGYGALAPLGNNICGDNYLVKHLNNSKIMAAISDGMGKGINANIQSIQTLKMLDEITNMNIMSDTALQILNTLFHIQDYQEIYSTLDFVEINRQKGEGLFYKAGGTTTYVFHNNGDIERIENENLPFGVEEMIDIKKIKLYDNDLIIMASDGVFENVYNKKDLENYITSIKDLEPQKLIYEVLNYTRYSDVISKDDMSIVALKIKEC